MPTNKTAEPHAGRVALVSGTTRGIGQAIAMGLAERGARVILADRGAASETIALIADTGHEAVPVTLDVSDPSSIEAAANRLAEELGHVDILVNNAGTFEAATWDDLDFDLWRRVMAVDLDGPMLMCKAFLPLMRGRGWGRVINIASATVAIASPVSIAYRTSKMGGVVWPRRTWHSGRSGAFGEGVPVAVDASAPAGFSRCSPEAAERFVRQPLVDEQGDRVSVIGSVDELLARASVRTEVRPGDGKGGARYERVLVDREPFFVKQLSPASDWIMRVTGDHVHRPYLAWRSGMMARSPGCIDHTVVAMQVSGTGDDAVLTMVMRDVGAFLVPEGNTVVATSQHAGFIEHMADLACEFWGWDDEIGLTSMEQRIRFFAPDNIAAELLAADVPPPIAAADAGWRALPGRSAVLWGLARLVHDRPGLVTGPLAATPRTFLHGDWKMGNLGTHPDGRTILLDWALPGSGPACWDLCWYLALNQARLPESKQAAIGRFRAALEAGGVATGSWWDAQLDLCLIAIMATFGWEKALGDDAELSWWERAVAGAAARQGIPVPGTAG